MNEIEIWIRRAKEMGFTEAVELKMESLQPRQDILDICATNKCGSYNTNWGCPPGTGDLETCRSEIAGYSRGILLQSVGYMEDEMDFEVYARTGKEHKDLMNRLTEELRREWPEALSLSPGYCTICPKCAYPEPCRFPKKASRSLEGSGIFVTELCRSNGMVYYYGADSIAYESVLLF